MARVLVVQLGSNLPSCFKSCYWHRQFCTVVHCISTFNPHLDSDRCLQRHQIHYQPTIPDNYTHQASQSKAEGNRNRN